MKITCWQAVQRGLCLAFTLFLLHTHIHAQGGGKFYLQPELAAGITAGSNHGIDFGNLNRHVRIELRGGYWLNEHASLFTGFAYASYHYRIVGRALSNGPDTIRTQSQEYWEIPLGIRLSTFYGDRSVRTRYYAAAGLRACFLNDARHDYKTSDGSAAESNIVRPEDLNSFWLRGFVEGGLDIPMDYGSAILIGINASTGLSRNANMNGALQKDNYGVLVIGGSIGLRIGLTPERPKPHRRPQHGRYK
jgi:hypothetical protein